MKAIHKLTSWIGAVAFATVITMAVPTQSQATWSGSWTSWSKNSTTACDTDKGSKGSSDKGSTCNTDKGSKGSKGSSDKGSTCNTDKGSKGSKGSSDKGSKGSKGSSDKGSKGSKDHKGSKGSCNCDGKITSLTLLNNGVSGQITVTEKKTDNVIFDAYVDSGSQFTFNGSDNKGTMGTEIYIAVDDVQNIAIHTSCSKPIGIGMDFGDFTVIDGYSLKGGQLCTVHGYEPAGNVCGTVYEDANDNQTQDAGETGAAGIKVSIMDANGETTIATTDADGKYCATGIVEGSATITVDTTTLPTNAQLTAGVNPNDITVIANENNPAGTDGYTLPTPAGKVCGLVFEDTNGNGVQDAGEPAYAGAKVDITDANGVTVTATTDADGKYCQEGVEEGAATIVVDPASLPAGATITTEDPTTITVVAGQANPAGADGFKPAPTVGKVCGLVFEDTNGNGVQDAGEPPYAGAKIDITDETGVTVTATTDADGKYCQEGIEEGAATIVVDPDSLPAGATITTEDPTSITVVAGQANPAGADGFEPAPKVGKVCGTVYEDANDNKTQDAGETGAAGIEVSITDANGETIIVPTDADGKYCASGIVEGSATITVDTTTLPTNAQLTAGVNPNDITVVANENNQAGTDGYRSADGICPVGYKSYQKEIVTRGNVIYPDDGLQTVLPITIPQNTIGITFTNVHTFEDNDLDQPYEQFKIIATDSQGTLLTETGYTTDINNAAVPEDVYTDLGTLDITPNTSEILLVHRADPEYGENLTFSNSVTFKGLCYRIETQETSNYP